MKKKYILVFILPIMIFILANIMNENNFRLFEQMMDSKAQYIPLLKYLKGIYTFDNSFFYSFFKGLGGSMWATFFYYLSSPLNLFALFFSDINKFFFFNCLLRIGLCGLTMFTYLNNKNKKSSNINFIFSIIYALMGFNICYTNCFFWLDVVYMTPIVLLGVDKLLKNGDIKLFIVSLSYTIFCNFYLSFSLCIFIVIYFVYYLLLDNINKKDVIKKFIFSSLIVGGLCSFFLIPTILEILNLSSRLKIHSLINQDYHYIFGLFYKNLLGSSDVLFQSTFFDSIPNLYCTNLVLILNILYFCNKKISLKEKKLTLIVFLFFISSMVFKPLYLFWHGFSDTNNYFYRFSYLWTFFRIIIAYKSLNNISFSKNDKKIVHMILIAYFFLTALLYPSCIVPFYNGGLEIIISIIFVIIYIFIVFKKKSLNFLIVFIIIELFVNCYISTDLKSFAMNRIKLENVNYNNSSSDYNDFLKNENFIRITDDISNASLYYGYGSLSSYLTTTNENVAQFYYRIGNVDSHLIINGEDNTLLINSLLGSKYYINDSRLIENDYSLSIGYMINYNNISEFDDPLDYQSAILNTMINDNLTYFQEIEGSCDKNNQCSFSSNSKYKILFLDYKNNNILKFYINGKNVLEKKMLHKVYKTDDSSDNININYKLSCKINSSDCLLPNVRMYTINLIDFEKAINILKEQQLKIKRINKNTLEGSINVKKDKQHLFLSIPYEKGWNIYVDGKKVKYQKLFDTFIGVKLSKGKHDIKMVFYPPGLNYGILISSFSIIILIFYVKFYYKK